MAALDYYGSTEQLARELNMADSQDVDKMVAALTAASRQIEAECGGETGPRFFWQDATVTTRRYHAEDSMVCWVDDISTATGLIVKIDDTGDGTFETTLASTDYELYPLNAAVSTPVQPWYQIVVGMGNYTFPQPGNGRPGVQVTSRFGWPGVPADIDKASLVQAVLLYKSTAAWSGALSFDDGGYTQMRPRLHPIASMLIEPFRRVRT